MWFPRVKQGALLFIEHYRNVSSCLNHSSSLYLNKSVERTKENILDGKSAEMKAGPIVSGSFRKSWSCKSKGEIFSLVQLLLLLFCPFNRKLYVVWASECWDCCDSPMCAPFCIVLSNNGSPPLLNAFLCQLTSVLWPHPIIF